MPGEDSDCALDIVLAQRPQYGTMVVVGAGFPLRPPGGEEKSGAGSVKIIDGRKQARHLAWFEDEPMEAAIGVFPASDIA